jgi:hypothetical protein
MKFNLITKSLLALALGAAAAVASADTFSVVETGSYSGSPLVTATTSLLTTLADTTTVTPIGGAVLSFTEAGVPTPAGVAINGTLVVSSGAAAGTLTFNITGTIYSGATESLAASAVLTGSTGSFAAYTSGVGNIAYQLIPVNSDIHIAVGTISANLQAVPEPASIAALGLAATGLLIRRRKS